MTKSLDRTLAEPHASPAATACGAADALFRAAVECARQHERLGRALELACSDDELSHIAQQTALADEHTMAMSAAYETFADAAPEAKAEKWWHAANALWHATREYHRRSSGTNTITNLAGKHRKKKFEELTMEFELERSALMALKQSAAAYRTLRPEQE